MDTNEFNKLFNIIITRAKTGKSNSYTKKLLSRGSKKIAQKVGEESAELIIDYLKGSKKRTTEEAVDLIYHIFVMLYSKNIKYNDIEKEIVKRRNVRR
jgi:phosphoribosyl-ATP pyrophosphohydrolase